MSLNLGGDGVITGCTSLSEPALTLSGLIVDTDTLVVDSANNRVGIGTTSPQGLLDVKKDNATGEGATLAVRNTGTGVGTSVSFHLAPNNGGGDDLQRAASIKSRQTTSGNYADLGFFTANSDVPIERMTINTGGKVGIGTTSPLGKLSISNGNLGFTPNADADELFLENTGNCGITIGCGPNQKNNIYFGEQAVGVSRGAIVYDTNGDYMAFSTAGLTNERLRIQNGGGISFNGDTAAANALDDYEEGTWTPGIEGVSTAGSYTFTGSGGYTKIGNKVTVWGQLIDITTVSAGSGNARITGLPFISALGFDAMGSILLDQWALSSTAYIDVVASISDGVNHMNPRIVRDSATDISLGITAKSSNNADVKFCITYTVA